MKQYRGTFYDQLNLLAEKYRDKTAIICEDKNISYSELLSACEKGAVKLIQDGLQKGDKVILWGFNCIEWVICFYSVMLAGGTAVLMNYGIHADEAGKLGKKVKASRLLYGKTGAIISTSSALQLAAEEAGIEAKKVCPFTDYTCTEEVIKDTCILQTINEQTDSKDTQVIIYTTGTTAEPKAVQLSAYSIINDAIGAYELLKNSNIGKCSCNALPLFHSYGMVVLQVYLYCGKTVCLLPVIKAEIIADVVAREICDDMASVGSVYAMLTRLPDFSEKIKGKLNLCIVGGGFTGAKEMMRLEKAFGGASILCGYGQTECSPVISVEIIQDSLEKRASSVGHILPGLDVRVWHKEKGYVPSGETGEIIVKGYCTMNGYFGVTQGDTSLDERGYLHTGDLGYISEDNMLHLTGRMKEIIVRCGENVSPLEVEEALCEIDDVLEARVIGIPHDILGESVEACVVMKEIPANPSEAEKTSERLKRQLRKKLSSYKVPNHILLLERFPLNATGKTDNRQLRELLLQKNISDQEE